MKGRVRDQYRSSVWKALCVCVGISTAALPPYRRGRGGEEGREEGKEINLPDMRCADLEQKRWEWEWEWESFGWMGRNAI